MLYPIELWVQYIDCQPSVVRKRAFGFRAAQSHHLAQIVSRKDSPGKQEFVAMEKSSESLAAFLGARPSRLIGIGRAGGRSPSLQTGRAVLPHPAFRLVGSLSRRSALFARSPRMAVRRSVPAKSIALGEFHHWLALAGTRVGLSSGILSFIRPPSCPPWLHGHYPLRSYYGDSDSCPALSSIGQVSLITKCAFPDIPSPTTPCAPVFRPYFLFRADLAPDSLCVAIGGSSDFAFGWQAHQSHQAVSSLCRGPYWPVSSTDYPFVSSCSPHRVAAMQLLSTRGGKHRHRGTSTLPCTLILKRTIRRRLADGIFQPKLVPLLSGESASITPMIQGKVTPSTRRRGL
jgi:hypothetical protein